MATSRKGRGVRPWVGEIREGSSSGESTRERGTRTGDRGGALPGATESVVRCKVAKGKGSTVRRYWQKGVGGAEDFGNQRVRLITCDESRHAETGTVSAPAAKRSFWD